MCWKELCEIFKAWDFLLLDAVCKVKAKNLQLVYLVSFGYLVCHKTKTESSAPKFNYLEYLVKNLNV